MKNKVVKILATIGLIIAIALILRGVFDIGKIGFKNFSSNKNIIIFDKCWDIEEFKNYNEHLAQSDFEKWFFEIDLAKGIAVRTVVRTDKAIKFFKKKGHISKKIELDNFYIKSVTQNFVETEITDHNGFVTSYVFNLNNGQLTINWFEPKTPSSTQQCNEY